MIGVALRSAASSTSRPGRRADASARGSAWRRMLSARPFLPSLMILTTKRSVVRVRVGAYFALRGVWARRGTALLLPALRGGLGDLAAAALAHKLADRGHGGRGLLPGPMDGRVSCAPGRATR